MLYYIVYNCNKLCYTFNIITDFSSRVKYVSLFDNNSPLGYFGKTYNIINCIERNLLFMAYVYQIKLVIDCFIIMCIFGNFHARANIFLM